MRSSEEQDEERFCWLCGVSSESVTLVDDFMEPNRFVCESPFACFERTILAAQ